MKRRPCSLQRWENAFVSSLSSSHRQACELYGVSEWRARFSQFPEPSGKHPSDSLNGATFPLLLLPFSPQDILFPGQISSVTLRQGRYLDMMEDATSSYESILGLSVLDDDGTLAETVLCEILECDVICGYKGRPYVEATLRGVGRVRRVADTIVAETAKDSIHSGTFKEMCDEDLSVSGLETADELLRNIESCLPSESRSRQRYDDARGALIAASVRSKEEESQETLRVSDLVASSWAIFAALESASTPPSHVIIGALSTTDTTERLRLGLAMLLEGQTGGENDYGTFFRREARNDDTNDSFQ